MKQIIVLILMSVFLFGVNVGYASTIDDIGNHTTNEWQWLGDKDVAGDGLEYSINGDVITLNFTMGRAAYGRHVYDQLKVWIDYGGINDGDYTWQVVNFETPTIWFKDDGEYKYNSNDNSWYKKTDDDDNGYYEKYRKVNSGDLWTGSYYPRSFTDTYSQTGYGDTQFHDNEWSVSDNPDALLTRTFTTSITIAAGWDIEDISILARVSCHDNAIFPYMTTDGDYYQGEAEVYHLAPVPEPATMLLLGSGLIGLAGVGRKKLIKK